MRTWIERAPVDGQLLKRLSAVKAMRAEGWNVVVLLAPDHKSVVTLGWRE